MKRVVVALAGLGLALLLASCAAPRASLRYAPKPQLHPSVSWHEAPDESFGFAAPNEWKPPPGEAPEDRVVLARGGPIESRIEAWVEPEAGVLPSERATALARELGVRPTRGFIDTDIGTGLELFFEPKDGPNQIVYLFGDGKTLATLRVTRHGDLDDVTTAARTAALTFRVSRLLLEP